VYQAENALWDKYTGILYIKIPNEQFKVFGFEEESYNPDEILCGTMITGTEHRLYIQCLDIKCPT
jgi:hypothetical protein